MLLQCASSLLEDVGRRLTKAEIDVKTLRIVQKNREKFLKLHFLLSSRIDESQLKADSVVTGEVSGNQQETETMKLFLDMRDEELEAFEKEREAVFSFAEMCSVLKSGESPNFKQDIFHEFLGGESVSVQIFSTYEILKKA